MAMAICFVLSAKAINPYAYSVTTEQHGVLVDVTYKLNAPATSVALQFIENDVVVAEVPLDGLAKGENVATAEMPSTLVPGTEYTMALAVTNAAHGFMAWEDATVSHTNRVHATVDANPNSPYFGNIYMTSRDQDASKQGLYLIRPDYSFVNTTPFKPFTTSSISRLVVAPNGKVWIAEYGDANSGIWIYDPADGVGGTATQFFQGTRASSGYISQSDGTSTPGFAIYANGANSKLYVGAEDYASPYTNGLGIFNIGQPDGSIAETRTTTADTILAIPSNGNGNYGMVATSKGVWICQNRGFGQNNTIARSLYFVTDEDSISFISTDATLIEGSFGAGVTVNADNTKLYMADGNKHLVVYDIAWDNKTPTLSLNAKYDISCTAISQLTFDYAGNLVASISQGYANKSATSCHLAVFSLPTAAPTTVATPINGTVTYEPIEQLYEIGAPNVWDPTSGVAMTKISGNVFKGYFDFTADSYFGFTTELAANNDEGGWTYISAYRYAGTEDDKVLADGSNETLVQANRSFKIEEAGRYAITVNFNTMKVSVVKIMADALYEFGDNQDAWYANVGVPMTKIEDNIFEKEIAFTKDINYFAFATEMANDDDQGAWDWLNSNVRYAGVDVDEVLDDETDTDLAKGNRSFKVLPGVYTIRVNMHDMTVTVSQSVAKVSFDSEIGYATYYNSKKGYTMPNDVTGYAFNYPGAGLTQAFTAGDDVPAGVALVLAGPAGTFDLVLKTGVPAVDLANQLRGTDVDEYTTAPTADEYLFYGLSLANPAPELLPDPQSVGFYWMAQDGGAFINKAHKAYLALEENVFDPEFLAPAILFNENNATNIENVEGQEKAVKFIQNGQIYIRKDGVVYDAMGRVIR